MDTVNVGGIEASVGLEGVDTLSQQLAKVRSALESVGDQIKRVQRDFQAGSRDVDELEAELDNLIAAKQRLQGVESSLEEAMRRAAAATKDQTAATDALAASAKNGYAAMVQLSSQVRGATNLGMGLSRAFQDVAQGGWSSMINNLEQIGFGLGQVAGLAPMQAMAIGASLQGIATAALVLYNNWDRMMDAFGVGIPAPAKEGLEALQEELKKVGKEIDELGKKARLSLPEIIKLEQDKTRAKALKEEIAQEERVNRLVDGQSKAERERGSGFAEAVAESGGSAAQDELLSAIEKQAETTGTKLDAATIRAMGAVKGETLSDEEVKNRQQQTYMVDDTTGKFVTPEEYARNLMDQAARGDKQAREIIRGAVKGNDPNENSRFAANIEAFSPEGKEKVKAKEKADREKEKAAKKEENDEYWGMSQILDEWDKEKKEKEKQIEDDRKAELEARAEMERQRRENVKTAKEHIPGVGKMAENMVLQAQVQGIPMAEVSERIEAALMEQGQTKNQAHQAAEDITKEAGQKVGEDVTRAALEGNEHHSMEERDLAGFHSRMQAGATGRDKAMSQRDQMIKYLSDIKLKMMNGNDLVQGGT